MMHVGLKTTERICQLAGLLHQWTAMDIYFAEVNLYPALPTQVVGSVHH